MHQSLLVSQLRIIFPSEQTLVNSRALPHLRDPFTNSALELDVFLPALKLGFEFQDDYHYITTWYNQETLPSIHLKDYTKKQLAHQNGITLIEVPSWWNGAIASISAEIRFHRPDISVANIDVAIPLNPPIDHFQKTDIPNIGGEVMQASFPVDLESLDFTPNNWWLGEKYDGIRCCWNPLQKTAYTRTKRKIALHSTMISALPSILLDCEVWFGRGMFSHTGVLVKLSLDHVLWDLLRIQAFDAPAIELNLKPFEVRYKYLIDNIKLDHEIVNIAPRIMATSITQTKIFLKEILEDEGEGIIARKLGSIYEHGRSTSLLKFKNFLGDQEGIVVGIGKQNAIRLRLPNDVIISVPIDNVLTSPPRMGDIVTFSFDASFRRSEFVNPKIIRIRTDVSWEDISASSAKAQSPLLKKMRNFMEVLARRKNLDPLVPETWYQLPYETIYKFLTGRLILKKFGGVVSAVRKLFPEVDFSAKKFDQDSLHEIENRRKFFENFAKSEKFDPLNPNHWYKQSKEKFMATKGAYRVISYHNDSYFRSLLDLFPDIGLDKNKLWTRWGEAINRRKFFVNFARENNFDPLIPQHWYMQSRKRILSIKGAKNIIRYHNNSLTKTLMDLFPNIGLIKSKLWIRPSMKERENRRKFFEDYARENRIDPLNPERWYSQSRKRLLSIKGINNVIAFHHHNVAQALLDLFPNIGLDKKKLTSRSVWDDSTLRRKVFEKYASEYAFDSLVPENWYSQPRQRIKSFKGASGPIRYYGYSISKTLIGCFPDIGLVEAKFNWALPDWKDPKNRREFFIKYAAEKGFDPLKPEHWYSQQRDDIMATKGASRVLNYHNGNLSKALMELFPEIAFQNKKKVKK